MAKISRIDWYLQWGMDVEAYVNTDEEQDLVNKFSALYSIAKAAKEKNELANTKNIQRWRKAYYGTLKALKKDGTEDNETDSRQLRKMVYEFVESKIDNSIPTPKMTPKYKSDLPLIETTEDFLRYNIDNIFGKYLNDRDERATYVDGTAWHKVWWDSLDNSHSTSGTVKVDLCLADQIVPQPGITDWRQLEYIFELQQISLARIWDLYHRRITPVASNTSQPASPDEETDLSTITMITCYYLNEDRIVGKFSWAEHSRQVICNEENWQIRKLRKCTSCHTIVPQAKQCPVCGKRNFKYENATTEILGEDLYEVYNPYETGESDDEQNKDQYKARVFLTKGTEIPFYVVRQLPFIPRPAVSSIESMYGISEAKMVLEMQDVCNKMYTKMVDKTLDSGAVVTKPARLKINDSGNGIKMIDVRSYEESQMVQNKQIAADTSQDIAAAQMMYESARATSGVTESFQGKYDASATSGKAKEFSAMQTAGRIESLRVIKAAAFSAVYELVLKYLLAFSDESQKFVKTLPDGSVEEEEWNKYMFLAKDKYGQIYYRDDFKFGSDAAASLANNRVAMWQELQSQYMQGTMGDVADPNTRVLFWNAMEQQQYPLAKTILAGIKENAQHLPPNIEQLLLQNPDILQRVIQEFQNSKLLAGGNSAGQSASLPTPIDGRGGARQNAGREGTGASHSGMVEKTNETNAVNSQKATDAVGGTLTGGNIE